MSKDLNLILSNFKMEKPKKKVFGNYRIEGDFLKFNTNRTEELRLNKNVNYSEKYDENVVVTKSYETYTPKQLTEWIASKKDNDHLGSAKFQYSDTDIIARKINVNGKVMFLGNSSILQLVGRSVAYGRESLNRQVTPIQTLMSNDTSFFMIPFTVFDQANLDITKLEIIEKANSETVKIKEPYFDRQNYKNTTRIADRHFTGAVLFKVDGKVYLMDIDRREVEHNIFNPFLATIKGNPKSINEAYRLLKPKAVIEAEKQGLEVLRQGEWFFIPTKAPKMRKFTEKEKLTMLLVSSFNRELFKILGVSKEKLEKQAAELLKEVPKQGNLQAGNSRPNNVELSLIVNKKIYCKGKVSHSGREHADLILGNWYIAIPNTSIGNFTLTGNID